MFYIHFRLSKRNFAGGGKKIRNHRHVPHEQIFEFQKELPLYLHSRNKGAENGQTLPPPHDLGNLNDKYQIPHHIPYSKISTLVYHRNRIRGFGINTVEHLSVGFFMSHTMQIIIVLFQQFH